MKSQFSRVWVNDTNSFGIYWDVMNIPPLPVSRAEAFSAKVGISYLSLLQRLASPIFLLVPRNMFNHATKNALS